ncbi:hypothetical protein GCM10027592_45650 [Spirosoma flavus]
MRAGDKILNYTITRRIKAGGMGVVFEGEQSWGSRRKVAIKQLLENLRDDDVVRRRFIREAEILEMLDNPRIVKILGFDQEQDAFVMEFVEGRTLSDMLKQDPDTFRRPEVLIPFFNSLLDAFSYAHNALITLGGRTEKGIVHRDIKPSNIIVQPDGSPKILDFGISRVASFQSTLTDPKLQMGSVPYMSPEQIATPTDVDWRSDIYSIGVTLWEMMTGHSPYPRVTTHEVVVEVQRQIRFEPLPSLLRSVSEPKPEERFFLQRLDQIIGRATAKDRVYRYQGCDEMKAALEKVFIEWQNQGLDSEETRIKPASTAPPRQPESPAPAVTSEPVQPRQPANPKPEPVTQNNNQENVAPNRRGALYAALAIGVVILVGSIFWFMKGPSSGPVNTTVQDSAMVTTGVSIASLVAADSSYEVGNTFYSAKDFKQAAFWYNRAAELGNSAGQNMLGWLYQYGQGVDKNVDTAVKWFQSSAKQGNPEGQKNLGYMYLNGLGVEKNHSEALKWYRASADQGNAEGQANLGIMYEQGLGVSTNNPEAFKWYMKAANQHFATAQYYVGTMYATGKGVEKSESKAIQWYKSAAQQGEPNAQHELRRLGQSWDVANK